MSLARLETAAAAFDDGQAARQTHTLIVMPAADALPPALPGRKQLAAVLTRRRWKVGRLAKEPVAADLPSSGRCVWVMVDSNKARFEQLSTLRAAAQLLIDEHPDTIAMAICGCDADESEVALALARDTLYVTLLNGVALPARRKKPAKPLKRIILFGGFKREDFAPVLALADANTLVRELTTLPPNELNPAQYRMRVRALARKQRWRIEEYPFKRLTDMGAGAFCAVAQGSGNQDAAIVRLSYRARNARRKVALVGKGICFDTGGHNLKPAKYMAGMHEDMNGSAVTLGLLLAVQELRLPVAVDAWVAIAQNHISPVAYKQNDIITALDDTTIEIVHTDAEGRLVLADTITLAVKVKPDLLIDFATLTGSMVTALGNRYAGVFASNDALATLAQGAGRQSGERVCVFPMDEDYESALESKVADVKQCSIEGEADHILAARLLHRFTQGTPWLHVDLSAANCRGGLGAVASDVTGFGVGWGASLLAAWLKLE